MKHRFTKKECKRGGKNVARMSGGVCSKCGAYFSTHAKLAGHLGLHGFADRFCGGDVIAARSKLSIMGAAMSDPVPENGAFSEGHELLAQVGKVCQKAQRAEQNNQIFDEEIPY